MQDIPAIAEVAHRHGAVVVMDNTWATPLLFRPMNEVPTWPSRLGPNTSAGVPISCSGWSRPTNAASRTLRKTYDAFAMCPGPEDVFLGLRGLRTMALRLREHEKQALDMARWLAARPEVAQVLHPALESHPGHAIWKRDFKGSSGLFSVVLKPCSDKALAAMLDDLRSVRNGLFLGRFREPRHAVQLREYRTATPWAPGGHGLRFHIGLEDLDDLKRDLDQGFERLRKARCNSGVTHSSGGR